LQTDDLKNEINSGTAVLLSTTPATYSVANLHGNFAAQVNLWSADPAIDDQGDVAISSFDGKGNVKGSATQMDQGALSKLTMAGTYAVNPDGTCSMSLVISGVTTPSLFACAINSLGAGGVARGMQLLLTNPGPRGSDNTTNYILSGSAVTQGTP